MSVGPRVVFVRFITSDSPKLTPWIAHVRRVIGSRHPGVAVAVPPAGDGVVVWQLVSANNRQLGRGVGIHGTFDDARAEAARVVEAGSDLSIELVSEAGRGLYGWFATLDGAPVVTCARWYFTDRDRRHAMELALASIPIATLHSGARLADPALMAGGRGAVL